MGREVERRLRAVEATLGGSACPECGTVPGLAPTGYDVVCTDDAEEDEGLDEPEFCGTCWTQTTYTVLLEGLDD